MRARKERYREQLATVKEEKRRVAVSLEENALTWDRREGLAASLKTCPIVAEGAAAYAATRAALERALIAKFQRTWTPKQATEVTIRVQRPRSRSVGLVDVDTDSDSDDGLPVGADSYDSDIEY